jgi:hypothetical protein
MNCLEACHFGSCGTQGQYLGAPVMPTWIWPSFLRGGGWAAPRSTLWMVIVAGTIFWIIGLSFDQTAKEKQICREAIDTFWTTKDVVEFERAKFLIEQVHGRRLGMPAD